MNFHVYQGCFLRRFSFCFRELLGKDSSPPIWPVTGSPRKSSDIVELISQELPDDSSDEEYCPQDDGVSITNLYNKRKSKACF